MDIAQAVQLICLAECDCRGAAKGFYRHGEKSGFQFQFVERRAQTVLQRGEVFEFLLSG